MAAPELRSAQQGTAAQGRPADGQPPERHGEYDHLRPLFDQLADTSLSAARREDVRARLITGHTPLAEHIAWRFRNRGQPVEDLEQVATIGLINAVDRFDPTLGKDFLSFAVPTITGVLRRYFRDSSWSMRVPRRLKEIQAHVSAASEQLSQHLGRAPKPSELAHHLDMPLSDVLEGLEAANSYRADSLDASFEDSSGSRLQAAIATQDDGFRDTENRETLRPALASLPERERTIVALRFFDNLTQTQIAQRMGISQMHVSRLLTRSLQQLRCSLQEGEAE